jgi:hypothetical protein
MPTNRRKRRVERRADLAGLTINQYEHLAYGSPFFSWESYATKEELVAAWRQHQDIILPLWRETYPGTRPFAWWAAEGRERRVLTVAEVRAWAAQYPDSWGKCMPRDEIILRGLDRAARVRQFDETAKFGVLHTHQYWPVQEDEVVYLRRHGLLTKAEEAALAAGEGHGLFDTNRPCLWELHLADVYGDPERE